MPIFGECSPSITPSGAGIVCIDQTGRDPPMHWKHWGWEMDSCAVSVVHLPLSPPLMIFEDPYLEVVWVFVLWLTSSGQMEVFGHYIHLISSHLVVEPVPKSSGFIGFFRWLESTGVVPNRIYSKREKTSQVFVRETWCELIQEWDLNYSNPWSHQSSHL